MTAADRRLGALAALFAPERARALGARASDPGALASLEDSARLATASRRERLAALATAVSADPRASRASAETAAALERPRVAAVLRALGSGTPAPDVSPPLLRLCRERVGR